MKILRSAPENPLGSTLLLIPMCSNSFLFSTDNWNQSLYPVQVLPSFPCLTQKHTSKLIGLRLEGIRSTTLNPWIHIFWIWNKKHHKLDTGLGYLVNHMGQHINTSIVGYWICRLSSFLVYHCTVLSCQLLLLTAHVVRLVTVMDMSLNEDLHLSCYKMSSLVRSNVVIIEYHDVE